MKRIALAVLFLAATAAAQIPVPVGQYAPPVVNKIITPSPFHGYRMPLFPTIDYCSEFAYGGWQKTLRLQLGEGADEYRNLIERAVEVWNEAVPLGDDMPLIEIFSARPVNFAAPANFWGQELAGNTYRGDGESVVYFTPEGGGREMAFGGIAYLDREGIEMIEADVYINTYWEEQYSDSTLVLTKKLVDVDSSYGAYALYNRTYDVILHELGHVVGLRHIPINGNVMSVDFGGGGIDQWAAAIALELFNSFSPRTNRFVRSHSGTFPTMAIRSRGALAIAEFFTDNAKLGEQEKTALSCVYSYWPDMVQ